MTNPYAPPAQSRRPATPAGSVQAVGRKCDVCARYIRARPDGVACMACALAFHLACIEHPDRCPRCGQSISAQEEEAAEAEAQVKQAAIARGRLLVWAAVMPYAVAEAVSLVLAIEPGRELRLGTTLLRFVIELYVLWLALRGSQGARRWLAFFSGLGAVIGLGMLATDPHDG